MKRIVSFALVALFVMTLPIGVMASSAKQTLVELDLSVDIPTQYTVITRNTPASHPIFNELGTTKSEVLSHYQNNSIYLNAIGDNLSEEIVVTMVENVLSDFNLFSDTTVSALVSALVNEYKNYGISVSKYEIYQHSQAKFAKLYFTDTAQNVHAVQYYTVYNNKAMNFTMRSYTGSLNAIEQKYT